MPLPYAFDAMESSRHQHTTRQQRNGLGNAQAVNTRTHGQHAIATSKRKLFRVIAVALPQRYHDSDG
jgi:hypothetical protein